MDLPSNSSTDKNINNIYKLKSEFMVENYEDLDKSLFGVTAFSNLAPLTRTSSSIDAGENKQYKQKDNLREVPKKVSFRDPNDIEDSLDDLLVDNSNNVLSDKNREKSINNSHDVKSSSDNLILADNEKSELQSFNFEKQIEYKSLINVDWRSSFRKSNFSASSDKLDEANDNLPSSNFTAGAVASGDRVNKSSRLKNNENKSAIMTELFTPSFFNDNIVATTMTVTNTATTVHTTMDSNNTSKKEPRRMRIPKSNIDNIDDPLGLLSASIQQYEDILPIKKEKHQIQSAEQKSTTNSLQSSEDLPEWLGGTKKNISESDPKQVDDSIVKSKKELTNEPKAISTIVQEKNEFTVPIMPMNTQLESSQQEPFVLIQQQQEKDFQNVTMLSEQTDQLINFFVESQTSQLNEQNKLFDTLIKRQIDRQTMLEAQIKLQQTRINHYIQAFTKQSMMMTPSSSEHQAEKTEEFLKNNDSKTESQCSLNSVQAEKKNLEYLQNILKQGYEREIDILKNSHETQICLMEESIKKLEAKLRQEIEDLQLDYEKKLVKILNEKNQQEAEYKEQIENLKASQIKMIKDIHTRHSENISVLQKEHFEMIENINRAKEFERDTVDFITMQRTDINKMLEKSEHVSENLQILYDEIKISDKKTMDKREKSLKIQEELLQGLIQQLHRQQEDVDNERKKIVTTAEKLQFELSQLSSQFTKNNELLNERETRLEMQEKVLIRERELFQEQSSWERQYLQNIKETWVADQKQQIKLLANERESLAAEKGKLEMLSHLKSNSHDVTKTELEAAIRTAHDAAYEANLERQKWKEKADSLQRDQRRIEEKETELMHKAKELEDLTQSALVKREEGMRALREAQRIEKQHKDQLNQLKTQLQLLAERESRIAAEKLALARERLELKVVCHQAEEPSKKNINDLLYYTGNEVINEPNYISPAQKHMHFTDVVDPQLLLLKINLDNRLDTSHLSMLADMHPIK